MSLPGHEFAFLGHGASASTNIYQLTLDPVAQVTANGVWQWAHDHGRPWPYHVLHGPVSIMEHGTRLLKAQW